MSGKKKHLGPRALRMNRDGRLQSARPWLATQRDRPAERIARSYRKRYGVDWACAIVELAALGVVFDAKWREQLDRTLKGAKRSKARLHEGLKATQARPRFAGRDENFAFIVDCTEGGAPFGVTWEEYEKIERSETVTSIEPPPERECTHPYNNEELPF